MIVFNDLLKNWFQKSEKNWTNLRKKEKRKQQINADFSSNMMSKLESANKVAMASNVFILVSIMLAMGATSKLHA